MPVTTATVADALVLQRGQLRVEIAHHPVAVHVRRAGRRLIRGLDAWAVDGEVCDQFIQFTEVVIAKEALGLPERIVSATVAERLADGTRIGWRRGRWWCDRGATWRSASGESCVGAHRDGARKVTPSVVGGALPPRWVVAGPRLAAMRSDLAAQPGLRGGVAVTLALIALMVGAVAPRDARAGTADAQTHVDDIEGASPLDLVTVRFEQGSSTDLVLAMRTSEPWKAADVNPADGNQMCVWLRRDGEAAPRGRICAITDPSAASDVSLRFTTLNQAGYRTGIRPIRATVRRDDLTTIYARFSPAVLKLDADRYHWYARTLHGTEDRVPNSGEFDMQVLPARGPATRRRCFGAPSRDVIERCENPRLKRALTPHPNDAVLSPNSPCSRLPVQGVLTPCGFGISAPAARETIALVGDSHAAHWRSALEVASQERRWHGVSITQSGCPLSFATTILTPAGRLAKCQRFTEQVPDWLVDHPEVRTVFVSGHAGRVRVSDGASQFQTQVRGYMDAFRALPPSVTRIVVIRDTPIMGFRMLDCVRRARAARRDLRRACTQRRSAVLKPDLAAIAARRLHSPRVRVVDLSRFLCSTSRCFPVVGGALVYKDGQHLTEIFSSTLGPYLLRALDARR